MFSALTRMAVDRSLAAIDGAGVEEVQAALLTAGRARDLHRGRVGAHADGAGIREVRRAGDVDRAKDPIVGVVRKVVGWNAHPARPRHVLAVAVHANTDRVVAGFDDASVGHLQRAHGHRRLGLTGVQQRTAGGDIGADRVVTDRNPAVIGEEGESVAGDTRADRMVAGGDDACVVLDHARGVTEVVGHDARTRRPCRHPW